MDVDEDKVTTLMGMGFMDVEEIHRALKMSNNDISDAVSHLFREQPVFSNPGPSALVEAEPKVQEISRISVTIPSDSDARVPNIDNEQEMDVSSAVTKSSSLSPSKDTTDGEKSLEFPTTNLYELESRVFTDQWSIPYKRDESLGKCLVSARRLAEEGLSEADENCKRFVSRIMPESFKKLMTTLAVRKWNAEIQDGIYNMSLLLMDFVAVRLKHDPVPIDLMNNVMVMVFDPENQFHSKNKLKLANTEKWKDSDEEPFAISPDELGKSSFGWLVDIVNRFGEKGGFDQIKKKLEVEHEETSLCLQNMAAMLKPLGLCAEYLNKKRICPILSPYLEKAVQIVINLTETELKNKTVGNVTDLIYAIKTLCVQFWPEQVEMLDKLRLDVILRMLKCNHFNARMNALKEVTKLINNSNSINRSKNAISPEKLLDWVAENKILSLALEGNIDQIQYCDKLKDLVEFLGAKLSKEELTKIWSMQKGRNVQVMENLSSILAAASTKFNTEQFDHLVSLIQDAWQEEDDRVREKLLTLIGKIGKESTGRGMGKVLDLLWGLAHLLNIPKHLLEHALDEHLNILTESTQKDQKCFVTKCLDDIKKGSFVLPSMKHLHNVTKAIVKPGFHKQDKTVLTELNRNHDIIKMLTSSLNKCHKQAVTAASSTSAAGIRVCRLSSATLVDKRYTHGEYVRVHLDVLQFLLQDGHLYLSWNRAKDIWDTLVTNPDSCYYDKELCFEWFTNCLQDLESDTQTQLFQNKLLKMDPVKLSKTGFSCFLMYFESVNINEHKLRKSGGSLIVEKLDSAVTEFFWEVALLAQDDEIADNAIQKIMEVSYINLNPRLKKDPAALHNKFINECYKKLQNCTQKLGAPTMSSAVSSATKTLTAISVSEVAQMPVESRTTILRNLKRILLIAQKYISSIEELYIGPRTILPHGASFHGHPIDINIFVESSKRSFVLQCHSNETVWSLRQHIAQELQMNSDLLQIATSDVLLLPSKNQCLLESLNFTDHMTITVKYSSNTTVKELPEASLASQNEDFSSSAASSNTEQEKTLPGVVMSSGNQVYDTLYQIADMDDPSLTTRVIELLFLIPTDPSVIEVLDAIVLKETSKLGGASAASIYESSPRSSPRFQKKMGIPTSHSKENVNPNCDRMKALFDVTCNEMSSFRVLYNLQVLSSKLMPTTNELGGMESIGNFGENLMKTGGLKVIAKILNSDNIPRDGDDNIRQSSFYVALQIARYLLCGEAVVNTSGNSDNNLSVNEEAGPSSPLACASPSSSPVKSSKISNTKPYICSISKDEFQETLTCFMRVAWAATAGKLHLANNSCPIREGSTYHLSGRSSRQSSSGSTNSNESDCDNPTLHGGLCVQQKPVSDAKSLIAQESLQLLFTCLRLRPEFISIFYNLRCIGDFIIDILLGSPNVEIRCSMRDLLLSLCQQDECDLNADHKFTEPRQFVTHILLGAHLPLWVSSSNARGASRGLLCQCREYFYLRCKLLEDLSVINQTLHGIKLNQMIEDEIAWLQNFTPSNNSHLQESDNALLSGHLSLIRSLLTGEGIDKSRIGRILIPDIMDNYLYPASKIITDGGLNKSNADQSLSYSSRYVQKESRVAAYDVLLELMRNNVQNLTRVVSRLIRMHHEFNLDLAQEFEFEPAVDGHPESGLIGLKNAGATCYMNSLIQQLYMQPGVREAILSVETDDAEEENVFYQFQVVIGHLMESKLQYYCPESFWKCFKLWGLPVNVREQQDAFEFFTHLVDQVDEYLKTTNREAVFKHVYEGMFIDQKICQDCEHRYEREESFMALNLTVKTNDLQESLDQFVKGEILEGENAYFCEKCSEKRRTIKRTCIKSLPPVLVVQLKRFGYDWEENRALKFDDHFKFPWTLDMYPYTAASIQEKESGIAFDASAEISASPAKASTTPVISAVYELVGIVVHSGQANAGHYYSFIKERRGDSLNNQCKGKWFKFNDTTVEEIEMNENTLETECFGGSYKAKVSEYAPSPSYPETRVRYWNAYMLFYERREELIRTPITPRKVSTSRLSSRKSSGTPRKSSVRGRTDSLTQLTQLVHHGERQGLFSDKIPARIERVIKSENLRFMQNRDVYNEEYFSFVKQLTISTSEQSSCSEFLVQSLRLAVTFLLNTYLHIKKKEKDVIEQWLRTIDSILIRSKDAVNWLIDYLASENGATCTKIILLECPNRDVRQSFVSLLQKTFCNFFCHNNDQMTKNLDEVIKCLLLMLESDVLEKCKTCAEFFSVLDYYIQLGQQTCSHVFRLDGFRKMVKFLLGSDAFENNNKVTTSRRWSSLRTKEFSPLYSAIATLILSCDLRPHRTCDSQSFEEKECDSWVEEGLRLPLPEDVFMVLFSNIATRFIREVVVAFREVSGSINKLINMLIYCSFFNETFTKNLLQQVMLQYEMVPSNELKELFQLLHELLLLEDPLQFQRIQSIIDGFNDCERNYSGMLAVIRKNHDSDSRRSYQCVKFLVALAHRCMIAKDYLLQNPSSWQWAVTWLKKKMTEHTTALWNSSTSAAPLSNEDSNTKSFQRTISAQDTLAEATAMLTELESPDGREDMEIDCDLPDAFSEDVQSQLPSDDFF